MDGCLGPGVAVSAYDRRSSKDVLRVGLASRVREHRVFGKRSIWRRARRRLPSGAAICQSDGIQTLVLTPDGTRVITGDRSGRLRVWDLSSWKVIDGPARTLNTHYQVRRCALTDKNQVTISCIKGGSLAWPRPSTALHGGRLHLTPQRFGRAHGTAYLDRH